MTLPTTVQRLKPNEGIAIDELAESLPRAHYETLFDSVREIGQQKPGFAILKDGKPVLLDGVTRLRACKQLERDFLYVVGEIACGSDEWILRNLTLTDRELTDSQRALIAADRAKKLALAAQVRMKAGKKCSNGDAGRTHAHVAKLMNVAPARVRAAQQIVDAVDIRELVNNYRLSLSKAAKIHKLPPERRTLAIAAVKQGDRIALGNALTETDVLAADIRKVPIPKQFADVFAAGNELAKLSDASNKIADSIESISAQTALRLVMAEDGPSRFRDLAKMLDSSRPAAVCPSCGGAKCDRCQHSGWLSYDELQNLESAAFAALALQTKTKGTPNNNTHP
jgi:hypothetical protein